VKRSFFSRLTRETSSINYLNYEEYWERFEDLPKALLEEWRKIEEKYGRKLSRREVKRLMGFPYEALFYYTCLEAQTVFLDAELAEFNGAEFKGFQPQFECIPLYDIISNLHLVPKGRRKRRRVPQVKTDFLVTYVDDNGPLLPALVNVKSSEKQAKRYREGYGGRVDAAMRLGFIF